MESKSSEIRTAGYSCNGKMLTFEKPLVMGIVNLTPDSFYDGGKYAHVTEVLRDIESKITNGADIIDLGAASTRPRSQQPDEDEEWLRLRPVLESARSRFPATFISVDTFRAGIARRSADFGADIINDISGGNLDPAMFSTVAALNLPYILMHMDGSPATMASNPPYPDVVGTVADAFTARTTQLAALGFDKIILDPGFGFGKSLANNYQLLRHLDRFSAMGFPVLAGVSRKSMISRVTGGSAVTSLTGTIALNAVALTKGASILRVHDVAEARETVNVIRFLQNA